MTIVLIDDDHDDLEYMSAAVKACYPNANCITFSGGEQALKFIKSMEIAPEYIFLDVNMNKIDGEECLTELRLSDHLMQSKVVMMSSSIRIHLKKQQRLLDKGAFAIAEKPETLDTYGAMFTNVIG